jgi:hypothetical protein
LLCFNFMILNKDRLLGFFSAEKSDAFFPIWTKKVCYFYVFASMIFSWLIKPFPCFTLW